METHKERRERIEAKMEARSEEHEKIETNVPTLSVELLTERLKASFKAQNAPEPSLGVLAEIDMLLSSVNYHMREAEKHSQRVTAILNKFRSRFNRCPEEFSGSLESLED